VGVTRSGPVKANSGVRARVPAAGKVLEGDDQQIYVHYITITLNFMTILPHYTAKCSIRSYTENTKSLSIKAAFTE